MRHLNRLGSSVCWTTFGGSHPLDERTRFHLITVRTWTLLFSAVARRMPLPLKCLGRSLALCWILRLRGVDATVHIGVRKEHDELDAHAWVQFGDCVINDAEDVADRYTRVIPSYSGIDSGV